jgi:predicted transcriptional regulator
MSGPRFASITAGLLARKGEAQPWSDPPKLPLAWDSPAGAEPPRSWPSTPQGLTRPAPQPAQAPHQTAVHNLPPRPAAEPQPVRISPVHAAASPPIVAPPPDWKKCTVRMSHHDYERLGILAVKLNKTRHCLLQEAVDQMLNSITLNYGGGCACLADERAGACEGNCSQNI